MPTSRAALGRQLLFRVLVLAPQALVLTLQAVLRTVHVLVSRQFVTQSRDLPVLLLDDNVPRVPLGWELLRDCQATRKTDPYDQLLQSSFRLAARQ